MLIKVENIFFNFRSKGLEDRYRVMEGDETFAGEFGLYCENLSVLGTCGAIFFVGSGCAGNL